MHMMDKLAEILCERGKPLTIVVYPWPDQVLARDSGVRHTELRRTWAAANGAQFIDLFPRFVNGTDPEAVVKRFYISGDVHYNEDGNKLVEESFLSVFHLGTKSKNELKRIPAILSDRRRRRDFDETKGEHTHDSMANIDLGKDSQ